MCKKCGEKHCSKQPCKLIPKCGNAQSYLLLSELNNTIPPYGVIPFIDLDSWAASSIALDNGVFQLDIGTYWVHYVIYLDPQIFLCVPPEVALYTFNSPHTCNCNPSCGDCPDVAIPSTSTGGELVPCSNRISEGNVIQGTVLVNIRRPCTQLALCNDSTDTTGCGRDAQLPNLILDPSQSLFNAFINITKVASC